MFFCNCLLFLFPCNASVPYRRLLLMQVLNTLISVISDISFAFQIFFSLINACCACHFLFFVSPILSPSFSMFEHRYVNWITISSPFFFCLLVLVSQDFFAFIDMPLHGNEKNIFIEESKYHNFPVHIVLVGYDKVFAI